MDLLAFHPDYRVVACQRCQYAVVSKEIIAHLQTFHEDPERLTRKEIRQCVEAFLAEVVDAPVATQQRQPPSKAAPIPFLAL
jgi:hypothetical protein